MTLDDLVLASIALGTVAALGGVRYARQQRSETWLRERVGAFVAVVALLALFSGLSLWALDGLLARMHAVNIADRGIAAITGPSGIAEATTEFVRDTIGRWDVWYEDAAASFVSTPSAVLGLYLAIDSLVFIPAYVTLLALVRWHLVSLRGQSSRDITPMELVRRSGVALAIAVADQLENLVTELMIRRPLAGALDSTAPAIVSEGWLPFLRVLTGIKWILLALYVLNLLPDVSEMLDRARAKLQALRPSLFRIRALIVVEVIFAVLVLLQLQMPDVMRRWNVPQGIVAVMATLALGLVARAHARRLIPAGRRGGAPPRASLWIIGGILVVGGLASWKVGPRGMVIPGGAILFLALFEGLATGDPVEPKLKPTNAGLGVLPRLLAVAPLVILGVGALRATLPQAVYTHPGDPVPAVQVLLAAGLLPSVGAVALYVLLGRKWPRSLSLPKESLLRRPFALPRKARLALSAAAVVFLYWRVVAAVWSAPQAVGAVTVTALFLAIMTALLGWVSLYIERATPPKALGAFGLSRTPLVGFFVAWILLSALVERQPYHDVRFRAAGPAGDAPTLVDEIRDWEQRNPELLSPLPGQGRRAVPMLFVSVNGGGIKAATWGAFALDCVLRGGDGSGESSVARNVREACEGITPPGESRTPSVFLASSVSGGSLGLASFVVEEIGTGGAPDRGWVRRALGDDFVSPSLAWQLFVEVPRTFLQFDARMDRAEVLERSWERGWIERSIGEIALAALWGADDELESPLGRPFLGSLETQPGLPLLIFNSATVEDGCRFVVSDIASDGSLDGRNCLSIQRLEDELSDDQVLATSRDLRHFRCGRDVAFSTAALMSARFPWVSPSGRLLFCDPTTGLLDTETSVHVVDGGYLDNSGGATVGEVWEAVAPYVSRWNATSTSSCIVPYMIEIDSGYGPTPDPKGDDVPELLVPLQGWQSAMGSRSVEGRNDAALNFRRPLGGSVPTDRLAVLYLRTQPGGDAPLGWTHDDTTIDALEAQLMANREALDEIAGWFQGDQRC